MAPEAPAEYKLPKGKPTWILVRSDKQKDGALMDGAFSKLQAKYNGQIKFIKYNWEDKTAKNIADEYSLDNAPASVLGDAKGHVKEKFEGAISVDSMTSKLESLLAK